MGDEARAQAHHFRFHVDDWSLELMLIDDGFCVQRSVDLVVVNEYKHGDMVWEVMKDMFAVLQRGREERR